MLTRLTATPVTPDTLRQRIGDRPDAEGSHAWCLSHRDDCIDAFGRSDFGIEVATDRKSPAEEAEELVALTGQPTLNRPCPNRLPGGRTVPTGTTRYCG